MLTNEQECLNKQLTQIASIFTASEAAIRPHFILTGSSGSGKSFLIKRLAEELEINFIEVNAAGLTKEGIAGNSLSKALSPLQQAGDGLSICFVDEFDKLFIAGNNNDQLAQETTTSVQNEFLTMLESKSTSVFGEYGKYNKVPVDKVLFVFAGAFNNEPDMTIDRLREFGVKTEFIGRVGLLFSLPKPTKEEMLGYLSNNPLLSSYLELFKDTSKDTALEILNKAVVDNYEKNTLGIRMVNTLIHRYFIKGENAFTSQTKRIAFQKTLQMPT